VADGRVERSGRRQVDPLGAAALFVLVDKSKNSQIHRFGRLHIYDWGLDHHMGRFVCNE
jgi:hypothetical protein